MSEQTLSPNATKTIYDLSPTLSGDLAAWPGDVPLAQQWTLRLENADSCNLSALSMSVHLGSHVDAPLHFLEEGMGASELDLAPFVGPARVIRLGGTGSIKPEAFDGVNIAGADRLLFDTGVRKEPRTFPRSFRAFTPEAAEALAAGGVILVGTDAPSVDPFESKELATHKVFARHGITILENLLIKSVPEGEYELIALPLKLEGFDASPVRAILRPLV